MLPRVSGRSPLITLPTIVASIDCELSKMIMTLGLVAGARNNGKSENVMTGNANAPNGAASNTGMHHRIR